LSQGGACVSLLTHSAAPSKRTITLESTEHGTVEKQFDCDWETNSADISRLLITTKSWAAGDALRRVAHRLTPDTVIVGMMNGMQHIEDIRRIAPESQLFWASTTAGCHQQGDKWVSAGSGNTMIGTDNTALEPEWLDDWKTGVPHLSWRADITTGLIEKAAINACINPLTAIHRVKNGALLESPLNQTLARIIAEVAGALTALGYPALAATLRDTTHRVIRDTAQNTSSMLSDILHKRQTEADSILGWFLRQTNTELTEVEQLAIQLRAIEQA
jgi:2-dehydropantoate 2-reductase